MHCLADQLATFDPQGAVWFAQDTPAVRASALASVLSGIDAARLHGKRVALGDMPALELAATLVLLDGLAQVLLLLPSEEDAASRAKRLADERIDVVLECDGLGLAQQLASHHAPAVGVPHTPRPPTLATTWLLPTSGTTGTPKLIAHTLASLTRSMSARKRGSDYLWGSLYGCRRFAGLQVFLQSWVSGTPLILSNETASLGERLQHLADAGCNALSATPSMWRKLSMHPSFDALQLKQITLGGEIADQAVLNLLSKRFPHARITHIYASTETGVGFVVRDGRAGFPIDYLDTSPAGSAMRIDAQGHLCFAVTPGEWVDSGDVVQTVGDRIHFLGRANGSINIGGNKVMPEEVESTIKELPEIAFVQVRARKSALLGSLVEAAISPAAGVALDAALKSKIISHCRARLDGFKVPAFVVAAQEVALTASGKLSRVNPE